SGQTAVAIQHCKRSEGSGRQRTGSSKGIYKPASMKLSMEPWSTCSARRLKMSALSTSSGNSFAQDTWIFVEPRGTALREHPKAALLHSLQSCKPGARVLDEHSAYTTASRVWGWVSGCPAPRGVLRSIP